MKRDRLLVIGARGPLGAEMTRTLRKMYGPLRVIAADRGPANEGRSNEEPYEQVDVLDKMALARIVSRYGITQIYLLGSPQIGTAGGPAGELPTGIAHASGWHVHTESLRNILELAVEKGISKVFWPSTVAVFGSDGNRQKCRQTDSVKPLTSYGIGAAAREFWSQYFWSQHCVDVRSIRFPGIISHKTLPDREDIFDYVAAMFHAALRGQEYACYLQENTALSMIYLPDAIRAALELMETPTSAITVHNGYNINAMSFSPGELAEAIRKYVPNLQVSYQPDHRDSIAQKLPASVDDTVADRDWDWEFAFSLPETVRHMLGQLSSTLDLKPEQVRQMQLPVLF